MMTITDNVNYEWSLEDLSELKKLCETSTPTRLIALKLARSIDAVEEKAKSEGLNLKPRDLCVVERSKPASDNDCFG